MKPSIDELRERDLETMARACAKEAHVTLEEMFSRSRSRESARARAVFYNALNQDGWTLAAIARLVSRDFTSVRAGIAKYQDAEWRKIKDAGEMRRQGLIGSIDPRVNET